MLTRSWLEDIEIELAEHFGGFLSAEEKETLCLCRHRNKVLHSDFYAAREKLNELGMETSWGDVRKIDFPVVSIAEISSKLRAAEAGTEGTLVADISSTDTGSVLGKRAVRVTFRKPSALLKVHRLLLI